LKNKLKNARMNTIDLSKLCTPEVLEEDLNVAKRKRYEYLEQIGEGSFGEVKKAIDTVTGKIVAIKHVRLLKKGTLFPRAVFREIEALQALSQGQYIVQMFDIFGCETSVAIVMEYFPSTLADIIEHRTLPLPISHLKAYFYMMIQAISYCHEHHVIHRDIKPSSKYLNSRILVEGI
jgi:serine/threonine protein kinase